MRKITLLRLCLLVAIIVVAGALPAAAAAAATTAPNPDVQAYQAAGLVAQVPTSVSGSVSPASAPSGTTFAATVTGFKANEQVGVWWNAPDGTIIRSVNEQTRSVNGSGQLVNAKWSSLGDMPGIWSFVVSGVSSHHQAVVYYEVTPTTATIPTFSSVPDPVSATISPNTGPAGTLFKTTFSGFKSGEQVGFWYNTPEGVAQEAVNQGVNWVNGSGVLDNFTGSSGMEPGLWSCVVQGLQSGHQAIVYFMITSTGQATIANPAFPEPQPAHTPADNGRGHVLQ